MTASRPIRVLWLVKGLGPGGAEQLLLLAAKVADRNRFQHRLAYIRPDKIHLVPEFEASGIHPERLGAGRRGKLAWVTHLRQGLAWADIVHAHSPVLAAAARTLAHSLPRCLRPAVVVTEHNEWTSHHPITRLANTLTAPLDVHRWAVSEQVLATMGWTARSDTEVLIHGIDGNSTAPDPDIRHRVRRELGIADDEVLTITVANLRRNKDYPNLLNAAAQARATYPQLRFIAVGQGPLEGEITALHHDLRLGDGFLLLGFRRDVHELMAAADLFVLASAHEGLPVAIMEAFAAGLPVIATSVGGVPQQVRQDREGLLVTPGSPDELAAALVKVASDEAFRNRLALAAAERATVYDIRTAMAEQERIYEDIVRRRRRRKKTLVIPTTSA